MKKAILIPLILILSIISIMAQGLDQEKVLELDLGWEKALLESNMEFLDFLLAEEFIWVHNHASLTDRKEDVLRRARNIRDGQSDQTKARDSRDRMVIQLDDTLVVSGFTEVHRGEKPTTYHFMRTYVIRGDQFFLLANHTMEIP